MPMGASNFGFGGGAGAPTKFIRCEQSVLTDPEADRNTNRSAEASESSRLIPEPAPPLNPRWAGVTAEPPNLHLPDAGSLAGRDSDTSADHGPSVAAVVVDVTGRRWTRLPEAWRAQASLCGQVDAYDFDGDTFVIRCRLRSLWCCAETVDGLCGRHMVARLDMGGDETVASVPFGANLTERKGDHGQESARTLHSVESFALLPASGTGPLADESGEPSGGVGRTVASAVRRAAPLSPAIHGLAARTQEPARCGPDGFGRS